MDHYKSKQSGRQRRLFGILGGLPIILLFGASAYGQPANDECTGATVIAAIPYVDSIDTTTATSNPADPSLSCNGSGAQTDGNTVWYQWTPAADIAVNISTVGSTELGGNPLDTAHGVYAGSCAALTEVACVDVGLTDDLFFEATGGETYYIKFGEFLDGAGGGNLVVTVDLPPPPEQLVLESVRDGISPPIRDLVPAPLAAALSSRSAQVSIGEQAPMRMREDAKLPSHDQKAGASTLLSQMANSTLVESLSAGMNNSARADTKIDLLQSFDAASNNDNAYVLGILLAPPDTDGDVGPNHYVQMVNVVTTIFDKSGNVLLGPFGGNVFWTGLGGNCENTNRGDVIVLYDEETDRWFVSQFAYPSSGPGDSLCIAVSTTSDPMGSYYQHEFDFTGIGFPDYPKYGFATDAIAVMVNLFSPFQGAGLGAIDKTEAFSANPTTMVFFKVGANEFGFVAGDNDGPIFNNTLPTFFTNNGGSGDTIDVWEIVPDFAVPANSTIAEVASIPVTPFDADLCGAPRERCIEQPGSGTGTFPNNVTFLEAIADRLMHRLQLRDFGQEKFAMVNHTVDADGNGKAGVRWYEFRNHKDRGWTLNREGTFAPDDDHRWMGSIAMTAGGETCLGYSISGANTYPSIGVAGRRGDANLLNRGEFVAFDGNVDKFVQLRTARWGDYSAMAIDPVDDTCWFTTEYAKPNDFIGEQFGWGTKVVEFDLR
jgi:hypothetical protein